MKKFFLVLVAVFALAACGDTAKLDGTTDASLKESSEKMIASLPEDQQKPFAQALILIGLNAVMNPKDKNTPQDQLMRDAYNGKTANDILKEAEAIKAKNK